MTGLVFLPLGIVLKQESDAIVEYAVQYDGAGKSLTISLVIPYMHTSILVLTLVEIGGLLSIIYGCA
jgi:ABC-type polysaccharide transport system permease subunit